MSLNQPDTVILNDWDKFVIEVLRPQGLIRDLNGEIGYLERYFNLRLKRVKGDQEVQKEIVGWNQEMERKNPVLLQRIDPILGAINDYLAATNSPRPGMKTRGRRD